jgi:hypothetical protein
MFKALLIGIAEYSQVRKLTKTTNDVYGLRQALVNNGYLYGYIDCLVNQQATKQEILKRLDTLAASGENEYSNGFLFWSWNELFIKRLFMSR